MIGLLQTQANTRYIYVSTLCILNNVIEYNYKPEGEVETN